jgi:hypothetical protein
VMTDAQSIWRMSMSKRSIENKVHNAGANSTRLWHGTDSVNEQVRNIRRSQCDPKVLCGVIESHAERLASTVISHKGVQPGPLGGSTISNIATVTVDRNTPVATANRAILNQLPA